MADNYKEFVSWLKRQELSNDILASHGTNTYALTTILKDGLIPRSENSFLFSGESLAKFNKVGNKYVSVSISKDKGIIYDYFLTMGIYYAERVSSYTIRSRNKYLNEYLIKKYFIESEGGLDSYCRKVLGIKSPNFTDNDLKKYITQTSADLEYLKANNYIPKYIFTPKRLENHIRAIKAILIALERAKLDDLVHQLNNKRYYKVGSIRHYIKEELVLCKHLVSQQSSSDLYTILSDKLNYITSKLDSFKLFDEAQKYKILHSKPVVVLANITDLTVVPTTSKILCERLVANISLERIIAIFVSDINVVSQKGRYRTYPIQFLYKYESEKIKSKLKLTT